MYFLASNIMNKYIDLSDLVNFLLPTQQDWTKITNYCFYETKTILYSALTV